MKKEKTNIKTLVLRLLKKIKRNTNNFILCIRFPFLLSRNRFTGLHYNNYRISNYINKLQNQSKTLIWLDCIPNTELSDYLKQNNKQLSSTYTYSDKEKTLYINEPIIHGDPFYISINNKIVSYIDPGEILSLKNYDAINKNDLKLYFVTTDNNVKLLLTFNDNNYNLYSDDKRKYFYKLTFNKIKLIWANICNWIYKNPIQWLHIFPTYTELDALDIGWRKAFGIQLCKDIKKALLKHGGIKLLLNFRILQIKEKWGFLHFYCNYSVDCINEIIFKYEGISEKTCINCGKPAIYRSRSWISPWCENCINKDKIEEYDIIK